MSKSYTGADLFVDALEQYGVTHVFGNPGTTELPVVRSIGESDLEYVLSLHEDIAVGAAAGYAQTCRHHTKEMNVPPIGVVNLHIAPGLAHGLGNVYNASMTGAPLVVTAGNNSLDHRHEEPILSGDLPRLAEQFCKWSDEVLHIDALPTMLRRAFRVALTPPTGPVFLGLPLDVMMTKTDRSPERLGDVPTAGRGDPIQIKRAADLLTAADDPVLVVGDGIARSGTDAVEAAVRFAEITGVRVHGEILSSEVNFRLDHEQWVSFIPLDENVAAVLQNTDTLVFVGCSTHTTLTRHEGALVPTDATCIHIGNDAWEVGKNNPADAAIFGDPGLVLTELADDLVNRVSAADREARLEQITSTKEWVADQMAGLGAPDSEDPRASKAELVDAIATAAPEAYVVDEGITSKYVMLSRQKFEPQQYISNKGGGLGYGLPAAIGAAVAEGQRDEPRAVLGFVGDGSYLYYPHTLYTAARYNLDLTVVIPDNRNYRILKDNQLSLFGGDEADHEFLAMDFDPPIDIVANAKSHGAHGELVDNPNRIETAIQAALSRPGPDVLDVLVHD